MPELKPKKKMVDVVRKKSGPALKKIQEEKINEAVKKIDKQFEQFEKKEEQRFKAEEKFEKIRKIKFSKAKKIFFAGLGVAIILGGAGIYLANNYFAKAKISIETKKFDWTFIDSVSADKKVVQIGDNEIANKQIPAEIFSIEKNFTFSYSASGKKNVQNKAGGKITIYNAFSSSPQSLVANTRFMSPDGKIFRLIDKITIPAAKIVNGKISASSIDAQVIADKAGPEYNIGPQSKFTIPGFEGTSKYTGFYASSQTAMSGGFIGEAAYPTDNDVKNGKADAEKQIKDMTDSALTMQIPQDFKFLDGSKQFAIVKETVNTQTDDKGNFSIFIDAKSSSIGFMESSVVELAEKTAQKSPDFGDAYKIKSYTLEYGAARPDFINGKISFAVTFKGVLEVPVNIDDFKQQVVGKNEQQLKSLAASYDNIQKFSVSFWPVWMKNIPKDIKRISVVVN